MPSPATVGQTRAFLQRCYGVLHDDSTHYVIVAADDRGLTVGTCCDGVAEAAGLLRKALGAITGNPLAVDRDSPSVIVKRADLEAVLRAGWPSMPTEVESRLREVLGQDDEGEGTGHD